MVWYSPLSLFSHWLRGKRNPLAWIKGNTKATSIPAFFPSYPYGYHTPEQILQVFFVCFVSNPIFLEKLRPWETVQLFVIQAYKVPIQWGYSITEMRKIFRCCVCHCYWWSKLVPTLSPKQNRGLGHYCNSWLWEWDERVCIAYRLILRFIY